MRSRVIKLLEPLHGVAVENDACPGTPDVTYVGGWLELKSRDAWPKRPETPLRVRHFTQEQRIWLRAECAAGGRAFLLLRVRYDWLLFWGETAADVLGTDDGWRANLVNCAIKYWPDRLNEQELYWILR